MSDVILRIEELEVEPAYVEIAGKRYRVLRPPEADPLELARIQRLAHLAQESGINSYELAIQTCEVLVPDLPREVICSLRPRQAFDLAIGVVNWFTAEFVREFGGAQGAGPLTSDSSSRASNASTEEIRSGG